MRKRLIVVCSVCAALLAVTGALTLNRTFSAKEPLTLRYVTTGLFTNHGYVYSGTVLWATNHTGNPLKLIQTHVERRDGPQWILASEVDEELFFHVVNASRTTRHLYAHEAGYATLQISDRPTGPWRLKVTVAEQLRGLAGLPSRLRSYRDRSHLPPPLRPTSRFLNPWDDSSAVYGRIVEVTSQEIHDQ